jgi:hypothetical protein
MAHNSRIRAPGTWASLTTVSPSEFELFDTYTFEAINGDDGGTWAPSAQIIIGGLGLSVTGPCALGNLQNSTIALSHKITAANAASLDTALVLGEYRTLDMLPFSRINCGDDALIDVENGGKVDVFGAGSIVDIRSSALLNIATDGLFLCQANLATSGPLVRANALARTRHTGRVLSVTDTDTLAGVENDLVIMNVTGATTIILTLKVTTAPTPTEGERIVVRKDGVGAGGLTVRSEGLAGTVVNWVGSNIGTCELIYVGGRWRALAVPINGVAGPGA